MQTIVRWVMTMAFALSVAAAGTIAPYHFSGRVVDGAGQPVAGATVARYTYGDGLPHPGVADLQLEQRVTTGEDGSSDLVLPRAPAVFLASKGGLAPAWCQSWNTRKALTNQQLVLTAPTILRGVVVDEADKAMSADRRGQEHEAGAAPTALHPRQ